MKATLTCATEDVISDTNEKTPDKKNVIMVIFIVQIVAFDSFLGVLTFSIEELSEIFSVFSCLSSGCAEFC